MKTRLELKKKNRKQKSIKLRTDSVKDQQNSKPLARLKKKV